jgi:hypothetical protein
LDEPEYPAADGATRGADPNRKQRYRTPQLQEYGDLATITQTKAGTKTKDGSGHPNKHFTS